MWHALLAPLLAVPAPIWQTIIGFEKSAKAPTQEFAYGTFVRADGSSVVLCQSATGDAPPGGQSGFSLTWLSSDGTPLRTAWTGYHEGDVQAAYFLPDGGFLLSGTLGDVDSGLARFDAQGRKLWARAYEWPEGTQGIGFVRVLDDGNYLVQMGPHRTRIDGQGSILDTHEVDHGFQVADASFRSDGSYFGFRSSGGDTPLPDNATYAQKQAVAATRDIEVARFDEGGQLVWRKTFGGPKEDYAQTILAMSDGGCLVAGGTRSFGVKNVSYYFLRLDAQGNKLWEQALPAPKDDEFLEACVATPDGGVAALGSRGLVRLDPAGKKVWEKRYPGSLGRISNTPDGGFLLSGSIGRSDNDSWFDLYLVKTDAQGRTGLKPKSIKK